jgi:hypothetical protein
MLGLNGTSAGDLEKPRYFMQWITATNRHGEILIMGWCIRDEDTPNCVRVFEHEDEKVCRKMLKILNEE